MLTTPVPSSCADTRVPTPPHSTASTGAIVTQPMTHAAGAWPLVSLLANVVFITAALSAGMMHAFLQQHGDTFCVLIASIVGYNAHRTSSMCCLRHNGRRRASPLRRVSLRWPFSPPVESESQRTSSSWLAQLAQATS
eukprot:6209570-Pleurochrysis_carterae.AAC.6